MSSIARCACAALVFVACSHTASPPPSAHARLPAGVAARVSADDIALETVLRIARAQGVSLESARDKAISDALFAADARATFAGTPITNVIERAALARALLEALKHDALASGPPTDGEITELTALHWREFDRPESARTSHAVALVEKAEDAPKALAVAKNIYASVQGAKGPEEFLRLARAVPHDGVEVRAERLPAVTPDGRVLDPDNPSAGSDQTFDPDFAAAATQLAAGQISEPTKTHFGYHVIFCESRLPALRVPLEQRRQLLREEVVKRRAERAKQELLKRASTAQPIELSRAADELTSRVSVEE
jgi:hypothetical protein